jgi:PhoH-like ATPase
VLHRLDRGDECASRAVEGNLVATAKRAGKAAPSSTDRRTYVLDTSVLLADPGAVRRFQEHEVVLPVVVVTELEG